MINVERSLTTKGRRQVFAPGCVGVCTRPQQNYGAGLTPVALHSFEGRE